MYDFSPSPEMEILLQKTRHFMEEYVYPAEAKIVDHRGLPQDLLKQLQEKVKKAGMWAPHMPKDAGGMGIGVMGLALMNEIIGRSPIGPRIFGCAAPDTGNAEILYLHGTPEQKEKYLQPLMAGDIRSCFSMTEPDVSGSDPTLLQTRALQAGDEWIINGHKWFTSNAVGAQFAIVMAVTDPDAGPYARASMIIVDTDTPGFRIMREVPVMGSGGEGGHCEIRYENCRVPLRNLLGKRGAGFKIAQDRLGPGRIQHCMRWLGIAQRSFEIMCKFALTRWTAGSFLAEKQTIQNFIADSAAEMQAARLMTLHAAWKMDQGDQARVEISLIKFFGARVLHDVIDRAIQTLGAHGYSRDYPLEAFYRDARAARFVDGPDEVHRVVVARRILKQFQSQA